jgi:hypothetical protein
MERCVVTRSVEVGEVSDAEAVEQMHQVWRGAFTQRPLAERVAEQRFRVVNVTRANCLPGAGPFDDDSAVVLSETEQEPHIITGQLQPKCLFRGTLKGAHEFVRTHLSDEEVSK